MGKPSQRYCLSFSRSVGLVKRYWNDKHTMAPRIARHRDRPQLLATAPTIAIGPSPVVVQRPLDATNRFYRGA